MGKSAVKSVQEMLATLRDPGALDGYLVPASPHKSATFASGSGMADGLMVPNRRKPGRRALLDGNFARRKHPVQASEYYIWDTELPGFGLRIHPTGRYHWFVRLRHRGKHRRITLGRSDELDAALARTQARRLLAEVALDGLPKRTVIKSTPELTDYVETYWSNIARYWNRRLPRETGMRGGLNSRPYSDQPASRTSFPPTSSAGVTAALA